MNQVLIKEEKFSFIEIGEGQPIVLLHGLMGGLSNFEGILNFYPKVATKEIVDEVFKTVNDRNKLVRTLALAKSAIGHNMATDLPNMTTPTALVWGNQDIVTPPTVAEEFMRLLPDAELFWIDKCGHAPMMEHPDLFNLSLIHI